MQSVFGGMLRYHAWCAQCTYVSECLKPILDLSDIRLQYFDLWQPSMLEILDETNGWVCSACNERNQASKGLSVHAVPNALVLHFDAFSGKLKNRLETLAVDTATYRLVVVSVHSGASLVLCFCQEPWRSTVWNEWCMRFNGRNANGCGSIGVRICSFTRESHRLPKVTMHDMKRLRLAVNGNPKVIRNNNNCPPMLTCIKVGPWLAVYLSTLCEGMIYIYICYFFICRRAPSITIFVSLKSRAGNEPPSQPKLLFDCYMKRSFL